MNSRSIRFALLLAATGLMPLKVTAADSLRLLTEEASSPALSNAEMMAMQPAETAKGAEEATTNKSKGPDAVEMAALYYYAQQKQDTRVEAEAARLRLKYPDFTVPADVYLPATARGVDEKSLWDLYEKSEFTGIDAEIIRRKTETPDWAPTADFTEKLARKKQRVAMMQAAMAKDWGGVIVAGAALDPKSETEIDLLWMMIDAYAATGNKEALAPLYQGILFRPADKRVADAILVTTIQKAVRDFPSSDVRAVMQTYAANPVIQAGLQTVAVDLLRKDVGEFNADETRTGGLPMETVERLEQMATAQSKPADLSLLGWYYLKIKQPAMSTPWFRQALAAEKTPNNAKGLYLSLAAQNLEQEAFQVAADNLQDLSADPEFLMNALSLRFSKPELAVIDETIVASYSTTILQTLNADHAEILAWYAYNSRQYEAAEAWFEKSFSWENAPARLKGLGLSYLRLGKKQDYAALQAEYGEAYPDIWEEMKGATPPRNRKSVAVFKPQTNVSASYKRNFEYKNYSGCISDLQGLEARRALPADAQVIKGWCYLGLIRLSEAKQAFGQALKAGGQVRKDAAYGLALTLLRGKLTDEAEATLGLYPQIASRDREIRTEIYLQRARSAFDLENYDRALDALNARASLVAETPDLTQLRGWAHYKMGNKQVAKQIFARLNMRFGDADSLAGIHASEQ
ncbi:hypothetical protein [Pararhizobium sp.]|uniref:hypothetical protein n=1 Tax=Pararhizobium sp. TaxID=1977563 RepID=UPI00271BCAA0|nr:hypothetical protein [Pararhizobium sp.]MDO9418301.1 hypothetical protein [Pararhizobium sp.]